MKAGRKFKLRQATRSPVLYPAEDCQIWAARYQLSMDPHECSNCGVPQFPIKPFATSTWRGLQAVMHECGPDFQLIRAREIDPARAAEWKTAFEIASASLKEY